MASVALNVEEIATVFGPENAFFSPSALPFSAPPFDRIRDEHYLPAFEEGMREQLREMEAIARDPRPATFANTLVPLEQSGELLGRVALAFFALASAHTNPVLQQIQQEVAPKLAANSDALYLNASLFARVQQLYRERADLDLDRESLRLLEVTFDRFVKAGALLGEAAKEELKQINMQISTLQADFLARVMSGMREGALLLHDERALAGLPDYEIAAAREAAASRGLSGFALTLQNTTQQPALAQLSDRTTRAALWQQSLQRNEQGNAADTRELVAQLALLRARKAALLGFPSFAAWKLGDQMARTPERAVSFLDALVPAAKASVAAEAEAMQQVIGSAGESFALEPYDWAFYAEQVRKAQFEINEDVLKPYFELNRVFEDGVLFAATELYGITFQPRSDLPVWHPDVRTYEVFDADGSHLALLYTDFFKRDSKRGGAWMTSLVEQSRLLGTAPVICNVCNYAKPIAGEPALLSWDEVQTLFHEFGHALHGLFSTAMYPSLSGTSVARDFVEFPSQFNEHWAAYPRVFANYARHFRTGDAMPEHLAHRMGEAKNFNGGQALAEVLAAAELDLQWHSLSGEASTPEPASFELAALKSKGMALAVVPPRYRSTYFAHIFGGGYSAGYYAYLWAEMLDADAYAWFEEHGGLTRANGDRLRQMVLSRGNTDDPAELYRAWRGRDAEIGPMLRERGIAGAIALAQPIP